MCVFKPGYLTIQDHLDYETKKSYTLNISASDSGNPKMTSYQMVQVSVTDVNDNSPRFLQTLYNANVTENNDAQTFVIKIQARDADTGLIWFSFCYVLLFFMIKLS